MAPCATAADGTCHHLCCIQSSFVARKAARSSMTNKQTKPKKPAVFAALYAAYCAAQSVVMCA
jgi:hypothetical protein